MLTNLMDRKELRKKRQEQSFYCPQCNESLLLKIGSVKIPHFAHRSQSPCAALNEPESPKHLSGKCQLHSFFHSRHFRPCLEVHIPAIAQRADLLVNNKYVIEYQCSPIPATEMISRTAGYRSAGFDPVWISGRPEPNEEGVQLLNLKNFEQEMLKQQKYVLYFNPDQNLFTYASGLYFISGSRWAGKVKSLPADKQVFPFARPRHVTKHEFKEIFLLFQEERSRFQRARKFSGKNIQDPFWRVSYKLNYSPANLPLFVGIPVQGAEVFRKHAIIWQLLVLEAQFDTESLMKSGRLAVAAGEELIAKAVIRNYAECCQLLLNIESAKEAVQVLYTQSCKTY